MGIPNIVEVGVPSSNIDVEHPDANAKPCARPPNPNLCPLRFIFFFRVGGYTWGSNPDRCGLSYWGEGVTAGAQIISTIMVADSFYTHSIRPV